jgi:G6PDH family F420-dependent oxidoreductase
VLGGIAQVTEQLSLGTGVTCPTIRIHPAILAHAAATAAAMRPGRFLLGVGTSENLNGHILGDHWPPHDLRLAMLEEAVEMIRQLWQSGTQTYRGDFYEVEPARIDTLPDERPPIIVAASGPKTAEAAGRSSDGLGSMTPQQEIVEHFAAAGGAGRPRYGQWTVCWAQDEASARRTAYAYWPNAGLKGALSQELPTPAHCEQVAQWVRDDDVAEVIGCGPAPAWPLAKIRRMLQRATITSLSIKSARTRRGFVNFMRKRSCQSCGQYSVTLAGIQKILQPFRRRPAVSKHRCEAPKEKCYEDRPSISPV